MNKGMKGALALAVCVYGAIGGVQAAEAEAMEKCAVVDAKTGKGLIKAHKAECNTALHGCAGRNPSGEKTAWILVPKGMCARINQDVNAGNMEALPPDVRANVLSPQEAEALDVKS